MAGKTWLQIKKLQIELGGDVREGLERARVKWKKEGEFKGMGGSQWIRQVSYSENRSDTEPTLDRGFKAHQREIEGEREGGDWVVGEWVGWWFLDNYLI